MTLPAHGEEACLKRLLGNNAERGADLEGPVA